MEPKSDTKTTAPETATTAPKDAQQAPEKTSKIEFREFKEKANFGVVPQFVTHPSPKESRDGLLRIKNVLDNPKDFFG